MKYADSFVQPVPKYGGTYPSNWAGYIHLQVRTPEGRWDRHIGDDYNGPGAGNSDIGFDVVAIGNGIAEVAIPWNGRYGYGNHIFIKHALTWGVRGELLRLYGINVPTPFLYSHYAHLKDMTVKAGQEVVKGQIIGHMGSTGTTWAHTHVELRRPTGRGYEDYPSGFPLWWLSQYYIAPFPFIEHFKKVYAVNKEPKTAFAVVPREDLNDESITEL